MAYKLISEWRSPDGFEHEIVVFKYNISHDEKVVYYKINSVDAVEITTYNISLNAPNKREYYGGN